MKKMGKKISLVTAASMALTLAACGSSDDSGSSGSTATTTETSETTTATMASEDAAVVEQVEMDAEMLENGTLRWLSFWSLEPSEGESVDVFLELFKTKYGGEIEWIQTSNETKYNKLAELVMSGDSPDMFPAADLDTFPGKASAGMFQPMDQWIDFNDGLFPDGAKAVNEMHTIGGGHYMACVAADAGTIMIYNKQTIEENGLDDPAELAYNNEWTWDALKKMCSEFCDPDNERYGIGGWWYELAMLQSTGTPVIGMKDGQIQNNVMSAEVSRVEDFFLEFHNQGYNFPFAEFNWTDHPEYIGEGKTLFYPVGTWKLYEPDISAFGDPGEIMFVPMPRDEKADAWYQAVSSGSLDAYAMCKGAPNPEAVAAFVKCKLTANTDESVKEVNQKQLREDYGWTDEMVEMFEYASELTGTHPVIDFYAAVNNDVTDLLHNPIKDSSYNGSDWYSNREAISYAVQTFIDEMNQTLADMK